MKDEDRFIEDFIPANAERCEPTEAPRCMPGFRWCWRWKDPTCVVGEQRKFFHLALCLPELACDVGDTSKWEFFKSSKLNSAIFILRFIYFRLIFGGFCSTFCSIFCLLPPWEKYKHYKSNEQLQKLLKMDSYMFIWHVRSCNFLWYHKLFFMSRLCF